MIWIIECSLNGPWVIFGHYLTIRPRTPSFRTHEHVINQVMGWVRLPKLPARYYHKSIIRSIGSVFGEFIKVDGEIIFVEYEGLANDLFQLWKIWAPPGFLPEKMISSGGDSLNVAILLLVKFRCQSVSYGA
ncbi:hypothetical protein K1719_008780 [Acacia pycnantha]|nr:hypothetical protein K1719_008780 [Acacia pycnantha]